MWHWMPEAEGGTPLRGRQVLQLDACCEEEVAQVRRNCLRIVDCRAFSPAAIFKVRAVAALAAALAAIALGTWRAGLSSHV